MTERSKNLVVLGLLLTLCIAFYGKILFTDKIIRAPDIINEFYWSALVMSKVKLSELFNFGLQATWDIVGNSGSTMLGGGVGANFNFWQKLIFMYIPLPQAVAWHIVLHLFLGATGLYCYCRVIGTSRAAAFFAGVIFALAPEMASLINAGHVMKVATISLASWAFFALELGFQRRRVIYFMATSVILAIQFFYTHWQIAFYTCLAVGVYGVVRLILILRQEMATGRKDAYRLIGMNLITLVFFLSTVAISLMPLASWSTDTNRGAQSGANQGKGGLNREEAMSWSMPPEELVSFVIPGFFGLSRQEGGPNPDNIRSYYWGRMVFTQTTSYIGLLPWLLVPLPLIFRRDRYTLLAMLAIMGGIVFSMGKYTPVYNLLYDYFPGINRFRVPKMIMFIPVIGLGALAARGLDVLQDERLRATANFRKYLLGIVALPLTLLILLAALKLGKSQWLNLLSETISQPTRYEQGAYLVEQRWNNILSETAISVGLSALYAVVLVVAARKKVSQKLVIMVLLAIFLLDVGRINAKFMFLTDVPTTSKGVLTPTAEFLAKQSNQYRVLPLEQDGSYFVSHKIPVVFSSMPVQQTRWQEILDILNLQSAIPDMLNVRYLIASADGYRQSQQQFGNRYVPVFYSPDGKEIVLENRNVLPKAWLVPEVMNVAGRQQTLEILQNLAFNPRQIALVESPPPIPVSTPLNMVTPPGEVKINLYQGERIELTATTPVNSLLVIGEKYYQGWKAQIDGKAAEIYPVNNILRGVYLPPGNHEVKFIFDPLPFKIGKWLTLTSFAIFALAILWEVRCRRST